MLIRRTGRRANQVEVEIIERLRTVEAEEDEWDYWKDGARHVEIEDLGPIKRAIVVFHEPEYADDVIWLAWIEGRASGAWKKLGELLRAADIDRMVVLDTQDPKLVAFWRHQGFYEVDFEAAVDLVGDHARPDATTLSGWY
jgi:hypothetical protein